MSRATGVMVCAALALAGCELGGADGAGASPVTMRTMAPSEAPPERIVEGVIGRAPRPGEYEMAMSDDQSSSCSRSWAHWHSQATLALRLDARGRASGCRTREARHTDPDGSFVFTHRHALGGSWRRSGAWIEIDLQPVSDPSCPELAERAYERPVAWRLRCIELTPESAHAVLDGPVLGCRFQGQPPNDVSGYVVRPMAIDVERWVVLGAAPGVRIAQHEEGFDGTTRISRL